MADNERWWEKSFDETYGKFKARDVAAPSWLGASVSPGFDPMAQNTRAAMDSDLILRKAEELGYDPNAIETALGGAEGSLGIRAREYANYLRQKEAAAGEAEAWGMRGSVYEKARSARQKAEGLVQALPGQTQAIESAVDRRLATIFQDIGYKAGEVSKQTGSAMASRGLEQSTMATKRLGGIQTAAAQERMGARTEAEQYKQGARDIENKVIQGIRNQEESIGLNKEFLSMLTTAKLSDLEREFTEVKDYNDYINALQLDVANNRNLMQGVSSLFQGVGTLIGAYAFAGGQGSVNYGEQFGPQPESSLFPGNNMPSYYSPYAGV